MQKSKRWLATLWGIPDAGFDPINNVVRNTPAGLLLYACGQTERGAVAEDNNEEKLHQHVYMRFARQVRISQVKQWMEWPSAHLDLCQGSEEECHNYCLKEETRVAGWTGETGSYTPSIRQGARSDLSNLASDIKAGQTMKQIADNHPECFLRYSTGIAKMSAIYTIVPQYVSKTIWIFWGPSGTGKTHRILQYRTIPDQLYIVESGVLHPWDMYNNQETILLDEFDWEKWTIQQLNRLLDPYPLQLQCRYQNTWARWKTIFFTSNQDPLQWFPNAPPPLQGALRRRILGGARLILTREDQGGPTIEQIFENI